MMRVVLVDDDPISTFIAENMISKNISEPITFFKYADAKLALNDFLDLDATHLFLDLNMPDMDGFDFLDSLAGMKYKAKVFFLTGSLDENDIIQANKYEIVTKVLFKPLLKKHINSIFN